MMDEQWLGKDMERWTQVVILLELRGQTKENHDKLSQDSVSTEIWIMPFQKYKSKTLKSDQQFLKYVQNPGFS
jgi:hypothetical protein